MLAEQTRHLLAEGASVDRIVAWSKRLLERLHGLEEWPEVHPIDEIRTSEVGRVTRKINVDDYLILYQVDHDRCVVEVVGLIHGANRPNG